MSAAAPYLSIVVAARNDDHGGGFMRRMQLFVDNLDAQCEQHGLDAELVIVEWNPPHDRPPLAEAIAWPSSGRCPVRVIVVPPELHALHEHAELLPLFQMIAKNVGIRRAAGRFVLATNVDVLFSKGLIEAIAERRLDPSCFYRADRHDVSDDVPTLATPAEQLRACAERVIRTFEREKTVDLRTGETLTIYPPKRSPRWLCLCSEFTGMLGSQLNLSLRRVVAALLSPDRDGLSAVRRTARAEKGRLGAEVHMFRKNWAVASARLHTNSCGDFTLAAREHWHRLRGYDELPVSAWFLDSMFLFRARRIGLREHWFPDLIYHIEHLRPDEPGVPRFSYDEFRAWVLELSRSRVPPVSNSEDWGLASHALREIRIGQGAETADTLLRAAGA